MSLYESQQLPDNPVSTDIQAVWDNRNGKTYYALNEKYSSINYIADALLLREIEVTNGYAPRW